MAQIQHLSSTLLPHVEVLSKTGQALPVSNVNNVVSLQEPGSIVKIAMDKTTIVGTQQVGNNLEILTTTDDNIVVENFFQTNGKDVSKIVIDDNGELFVSSYNEPFDGMTFSQVDSIDAVIAGETGDSAAQWIVPLVALGVIGAAAAIIANNHDSSSHHHSSASTTPTTPVTPTPPGTDTLTDAMAKLQGSITSVGDAQKALEAAIQALKDGAATTPATLMRALDIESPCAKLNAAKTVITDAITALKSAVDGDFKDSMAALQAAIDAAKTAGQDTTEAEKILAEGQATLEAITGDGGLLTNADAVLEAATHVVDAIDAADEALAAMDKVGADIDAAIAKAISQPSAENVTALQTLLANLVAVDGTGKNYENALKGVLTAINELDSADLKTLLGSNSDVRQDVKDYLAALKDTVNGILTDAETTVDGYSKGLTEALANYKAFDDAKTEVEYANARIAEASNALAAAKEAMTKAHTEQKATAAEITEINKQILAANAELKAAQAAQAQAQKFVDALATTTIDSDFIANNLPKLSVISDTPINQHLETGQTVWDVLNDFINNSFQYFKDLLAKWADTSIGHTVQDIINGVETVIGVIWDKIMAPCKAIGIAIKAIGDFFNECGIYIKDVATVIYDCIKGVIVGGYETIKNVIGGTIDGIMKTIGEFIDIKNIGNWLNPLKWVEYVGKGIENVVKNIWDAIKTVPEAIFNTIANKIETIVGGAWNMIVNKFNIIKNAIGDIINVFYDAFIKNPIEKIWEPIWNKLVDIITHPITSIIDLAKDIIGLIKDGIHIIVDIVKLPVDGFNAIVDLVKDIIAAVNGGAAVKIVDGAPEAITKLLDTALDEMLKVADEQASKIAAEQKAAIDEQQAVTSDETTVVAKAATALETLEQTAQAEKSVDSHEATVDASDVAIEQLIADGNADVNLDNVVPATEAKEVVSADTLVEHSADVVAAVIAQVVHQDEDHSAALVAA